MPCMDCAHGALRDAKAPERDKTLRRMARAGFVNCTRSDQRASFHAHTHRCDRWSPADADVAESRRQWFAKQLPA